MLHYYQCSTTATPSPPLPWPGGMCSLSALVLHALPEYSTVYLTCKQLNLFLLTHKLITLQLSSMFSHNVTLLLTGVHCWLPISCYLSKFGLCLQIFTMDYEFIWWCMSRSLWKSTLSFLQCLITIALT